MKMEKYSFSKLSAFHQCPLQYYYKYFEHVKGVGNAFAEYGTFVHALLEKWAKKELSDFELVSEYENEYDNNVTQEFPPNKYVDLTDKYYSDGYSFLCNFCGVDAKEILGAEIGFDDEIIKCTKGKDDFSIRGFIDLLYIDNQDRLVVHDWKSKSKFSSKRELKEYARQLYMYSYYIKKKYGRFPDILRFYTFRNSKKLVNDIPFNMDDYNETFEWIQNTVDSIRMNKVFAASPDDFYCNFLCDAREVCDKTAKIPFV